MKKAWISSVVKKNTPGENRRWMYNPHWSFRAVQSNITHLSFYHKYLRVRDLFLFLKFSSSFSMFKSSLFQILLVTLLFKYWCRPVRNIAVSTLWIHRTQPATDCHSTGLTLVLCFLWVNMEGWWPHFVWKYHCSNKWATDLWNSSKGLYQVLRGALVTWEVRENTDQSFCTWLGPLSKLHIQMGQRAGLKNCLSSVWPKSHSILHWQQDTVSTNNMY